MIEGLYKVRYRAPKHEGFCICVFKDGQISGGGASMYYIGTYKRSGNHFIGELHARKHDRSIENPILGLEDFHLQLDGTVCGEYGQLTGTIREVPGAVLQANVLRLCAL